MRAVEPEEVRNFIEQFVMKKMNAEGRELPTTLSDDCDLLLTGVVDSFGILELVTALSDFCGQDIDFDQLDPDQMTIVEPLCRFVSAQSFAGSPTL